MAKKQSKETEIVVVLDRSGSMETIATSTVEGFNSFLKEQKAVKGKGFLTLVQFDDAYQVDYKSEPIKKVKDLVEGETFVPRASTALFDAIGKTINEIKTERNVVFVIITDGMENASREFTRETIFKMIEAKKKEGWNFLFLAANQDAISTGCVMGIGAANAMTFSANNTSNSAMYTNFSSKISSYRSSASVGTATSDMLSFSDEDRKEVNQ